MIRLRAQISILLVAVLVLTGHSMAVARGMPAATGLTELCTGTGPVMTPVDADGRPTGPAHICPDFSLSLLNAVALATAAPLPITARGQRIQDHYLASIVVIRSLAPQARGPPGPPWPPVGAPVGATILYP